MKTLERWSLALGLALLCAGSVQAQPKDKDRTRGRGSSLAQLPAWPCHPNVLLLSGSPMAHGTKEPFFALTPHGIPSPFPRSFRHRRH